MPFSFLCVFVSVSETAKVVVSSESGAPSLIKSAKTSFLQRKTMTLAFDSPPELNSQEAIK